MQDHVLNVTAGIVSAFVIKNTVRAPDLPGLIASVHASLAAVGLPKPADEPAVEMKPAVSVKKSITPDFLICLDDGKTFKSLKRHLLSLGMTPDEYRAKWGLPRDYPMVAPAYAAARSALARSMGLGRRTRTPVVVEAPPPARTANAPAKPRVRRAKSLA